MGYFFAYSGVEERTVKIKDISLPIPELKKRL